MCPSDCRLQILRRDVLLARDERRLDAVTHNTLDVRTAVAVQFLRERGDVDLREILTAALADVEARDLLTLSLIREVHVEDLVEPSFAHELGRQTGNIVRGSDKEGEAVLFLHPREEAAEEACCHLGSALRACARKCLFQLVNPEDAERTRLRELEHAAHILEDARLCPQPVLQVLEPADVVQCFEHRHHYDSTFHPP